MSSCKGYSFRIYFREKFRLSIFEKYKCIKIEFDEGQERYYDNHSLYMIVDILTILSK